PGGLTFRAPSLTRGRLTTAAGVSLRGGDGQVACPRSHPNPQWRTVGAPGPLSFGCRDAGVRVAPFRGHRPRPAPANASGGAPRGWRQPASMTRDAAESGSKGVQNTIVFRKEDYIHSRTAYGAITSQRGCVQR